MLVAEESNAGTGGRGRDVGCDCGRPFSSILVSDFVCVGDSLGEMVGSAEVIGGAIGIGKSLCMIWIAD